MITAILITAYILFNIFLFLPLYRQKEALLPGALTEQDGISVVVAARNEESCIAEVITALYCQSYSCDRYEVIIVDDNSSDSTYDTALSCGLGKQNFSVVKANDKPFAAKKGALAVGIARARFDYIAITDADCKPEKNWLQTLSLGISSGNDMVFGPAPFAAGNGLVNAIARFENLRSSMLTFSAALMGLPYSAAARSFAFRKSAYLGIGGYSNTTETLSGDDDLLIREAVKHKLKIAPVTADGAFVWSAAKSTLSEYLRQKSRHTSTSSHYLPAHQIFLAAWHGLNLFCLFSPLLWFVSSLFLLPFFVKLLLDIITVSLSERKFGYGFSILQIICLQPIYELLLIVNFLSSLFPRKNWN
ncbi:MAG: glycosyltransferase [Bacteroidota bacterium]